MIADFRLFLKSIRTLIDKISTLTHSSLLSVIGERDSGNVYFRQKIESAEIVYVFFYKIYWLEVNFKLSIPSNRQPNKTFPKVAKKLGKAKSV